MKVKRRNIKIFSLLLNKKHPIICLFCISIVCSLTGCYSFTGGSIPDHLKTIYIAAVSDNSGYGNPKYRENFYLKLIEKFQNDNSLQLVERNGDARLTVTIKNIKEEIQTVTQNQLERERKVVITCEAEYFDVVKKRIIWKKTFSNFEIYDVANAFIDKDRAINDALEQTSDDILLAVVSGW